MDDIYHGYTCGEDCPQCHPEIERRLLPLNKGRKWRHWESFPGWEFAADKCDGAVVVLARPLTGERDGS